MFETREHKIGRKLMQAYADYRKGLIKYDDIFKLLEKMIIDTAQ